MKTILRAGIETVASLVPRPAIELARYGETLSGYVQGKGWGSHSLEAEVRCVLPLLPQRDAVVFDVGANKGLWSDAILRAAGSRISRLIAFEPAAVNALHLSRLASEKTLIVQAAVSMTSGFQTLYADTPGSEIASLYQRNVEHRGTVYELRETVASVQLDDFVTRYEIDMIHLLKMDIEGHELSALQGAARLLAGQRIRALTFEFGGCNIDSRTFFRDFWYLLTENGFAISRIVPGGRLLPIRRYTEDLERFSTTNYVAAL